MAIGKSISQNALSHYEIKVNLRYTFITNYSALLVINAFNKENINLGILQKLDLSIQTYPTGSVIKAFKRLYSPYGKLPKENSATDRCMRKLEKDLMKGNDIKEENFSSRREYLDSLVKYKIDNLK